MELNDYLTSNKFNTFIENIVHEENHRMNFTSFIVEIILSKRDYYQKALDEKYIDWIVLRIICNQWKSTSSPYFKLHRKNTNYDVSEYEQESDYITPDQIEELHQKDIQLEKLNKAIKKLPPHLNVYIKFWYGLDGYEKLSIRKIAKKVGVNFNTVYSHLKLAKEKIKENYAYID